MGSLRTEDLPGDPSQSKVPKQVSPSSPPAPVDCPMGGTDQGLVFSGPCGEGSCEHLGHPGSSETADTHARTGQDARTPPRDRFQPVQISPSRCWARPRSLTISSRRRAFLGVLPAARAGESHRDLTPGAAGQARSSAKALRELPALGQEACPPTTLIGRCS